MIGRVAIAILVAMQPFYGRAAVPDSDEPDAFFGADERNWGAPALIVAPDYPADAVAKNITGVVDVSGIITRRGNLEDISYAVERDDALVFVPALKEVTQFWRFHASPAKDCLPGAKRVLMRVWFELADGKPKISVSRRNEAKGRPPPPASPRADMVPLKRFDPRFPRRMMALMPRSSSEARVYARMEIDADGNVSKVIAEGYPQVRNELRDFEREAESALSDWKFPPAPEGSERPRVGCFEIVYRLFD